MADRKADGVSAYFQTGVARLFGNNVLTATTEDKDTTNTGKVTAFDDFIKGVQQKFARENPQPIF